MASRAEDCLRQAERDLQHARDTLGPGMHPEVRKLID